MYRLEFITKNVLTLTAEEQDLLFKILTNHADLMSKILPDLPLLDFIRTGNTPYDHEIIEAYTKWRGA